MKLKKQSIMLNNEEESRIFAHSIAKELKSSDVITFSGELGSGKTFMCREIIKQLCGVGNYITSPTFNLLQTYQAPEFMIYHFDLYRLKYVTEIYELGIEDALRGNVSLIEWPQIIEELLPPAIIKIHLQIIENDKRWCIVNGF